MTRGTFQTLRLDDLTGGINNRDYPSEIEDKQSQELVNWNFKGNKLVSSPGSEEKYDINSGGYVSGMTQDGEDIYSIHPSDATVNEYLVSFSAIDGKVFSISVDGVSKVYKIGFFNNEALALSTLLTELQADYPTYTISGAGAIKTFSNGVANISITNPNLVKKIVLNNWHTEAKIGITIDGTTYTRDGDSSASAADVLDWVVTQLPGSTYETSVSGNTMYIGRIDATVITTASVQYNRYNYTIGYKYGDTPSTGQYPDYTDTTVDGNTFRYDYTVNGRGYFGHKQIRQLDGFVQSSFDNSSWSNVDNTVKRGTRFFANSDCSIKNIYVNVDNGTTWTIEDKDFNVLASGTVSGGTITTDTAVTGGEYFYIQFYNGGSVYGLREYGSGKTATGYLANLSGGVISNTYNSSYDRFGVSNIDVYGNLFGANYIRSDIYYLNSDGVFNTGITSDSDYSDAHAAYYYGMYHYLFLKKTDRSAITISSINKYTDSGSFPNDTAFTTISSVNYLASITVTSASEVSYSTQNNRSFNEVGIYKNGEKVSPSAIYFCWVYTVTNGESYKIRIDGTTEYTYVADGSATEAEIISGLAAAVNAGGTHTAVEGTRSTSGLTNITSGAPTGTKDGFYVYQNDLGDFALEADSDYLGGENDMAKGEVVNPLLEDDLYNVVKGPYGLLITSYRGFAPVYFDNNYIPYELSTQQVGTPRLGTFHDGRIYLGGFGNDVVLYSQPEDPGTTNIEALTFNAYPASSEAISNSNSGKITGFIHGEEGLYIFKNNSVYRVSGDKDSGSEYSFTYKKITDSGALNQRCICAVEQEVFYFDGINRAIRRLGYEQDLTTLRDTAVSSEIEDILLNLPIDDEGNNDRYTPLWSLNYSYPYLEFNYSDETSPYFYTSGVDENFKYRLPNKTLVYNVYNKSWSRRTEKEDNAPMCAVGNYFGTTDGDVWISNKGYTTKEGTSLSKEYTFQDDVDFKRIGEFEIVGDISGIGGSKTLEIMLAGDEEDFIIGETGNETKRIITAQDGETIRFRERIDLYDDCERLTFTLNHSGTGKIEISDVNIQWKPLNVFHSNYF